MKAPLLTAITMHGFGWRNLEYEADMLRQETGPLGWRRAWQTVLAKHCALPRIACLVEESVPFRAMGGDSGWFVIRAVSEPMYGLTARDSVNVFLMGFLETKRMMGLKKNVQACVNDNGTGFYLTYPNDLIEFVLTMAAEDVPHAGMGSVENRRGARCEGERADSRRAKVR